MVTNGILENGNQQHEEELTTAIMRFCEPDSSVPASERGMFSLPSSKAVCEIEMPLRNYRTDPHITRGSAGLDIDGFTLVKHQSSLVTEDDWINEQKIRDTYIPEIIDLVKKNTGAKQAFVKNVLYRRKLVKDQEKKDFVYMKGNPLDEQIKNLPTDRLLIGSADSSQEPARGAHVDFTLKGMLNTARYNRHDIRDAASSVLEELDGNRNGSSGELGGRIAIYSIWRPLKPVHRDPLALAKYRSIPISDFRLWEFRHPGDIPESREYLSEAYMVKPPEDPGRQMWFWAPEQKSDEVWLIKFADTAATSTLAMTDPPDGDTGVQEWGEGVAVATAHCSPVLKDISDDVEPRESIEVRVLAFW